MFTRLKRYAYASLAVMALWAVVLLAVSSAGVEAQTTSPSKGAQDTSRDAADATAHADKGGDPKPIAGDPPDTGDYEDARQIVVRPGDSLWSISKEWLGPNATPRQIANEVERIYALNRHRIGSDPDLIFPGQELSVPPVEPAAIGPSRGAPAKRATRPVEKPAPKAAEASARDPDPETASKAPRNTKAEPVALPDLPMKEVTPEASLLAAKEVAIVDRPFAVAGSVPEVRYDQRRLLGLGFFAIAFGAALGLVVLAVRSLRERRHAKGRIRQQRYGRNYAYFEPLARPDNRPKSAEGESEQSAGEARTNQPPEDARAKGMGARDLTPEGRTPKVVPPDGSEAEGTQGGR